jgi:hypothetical protein
VAPELASTGGGTFMQTVLPDAPTVMEWIRRVGGAVTRFEVHENFEGYFKKNGATAVYPGPGNSPFVVSGSARGAWAQPSWGSRAGSWVCH